MGLPGMLEIVWKKTCLPAFNAVSERKREVLEALAGIRDASLN
jgi:hypothetical protein